MQGFSKVKIRCMDLPDGLAKTFNNMHVDYRVKVELGIGGLKSKWRRLQKRFDLIKPKFAIMFRASALITHFLHRRRRNMTKEIEGLRLRGVENRGWARDY